MVCPKCGNSISRFNLKPNCEKCGVHIMYYTQEADLARDAKITELQFARARAFVARLKAAYIGGKLPISRLVLALFTIGVLCLPFFTVSADTALWQGKISCGAIGIYNMISSSLYTQLFNILKLEIVDKAVMLSGVILALFLAVVLCVLCMFVCLLLAFTAPKRSAKWICGFSAVSFLMCVSIVCLSFATRSAAADYSFLSADAGAGVFAGAAVFAAYFAVNYIFSKNCDSIKIKDVDLQRIALMKRIKNGEVNIDDLPLPIFDVEEERIARQNAMAGSVKAKKKKKEKNDAADAVREEEKS